MKIKTIAAIVASHLIVASLGWSEETAPAPATEDSKPKKERLSPEEAFKKLDKDGNNSLDKTEYAAGRKDAEKSAKMFEKKDTDKNGTLSLEEFSAPKSKDKAE